MPARPDYISHQRSGGSRRDFSEPFFDDRDIVSWSSTTYLGPSVVSDVGASVTGLAWYKHHEDLTIDTSSKL